MVPVLGNKKSSKIEEQMIKEKAKMILENPEENDHEE